MRLPSPAPAPGLALLGVLLCGCGEKIPTPWSKVEGREEVVTTGPQAGTTSGGSSSRATTAADPANATAGGGAAQESVSCEGDLPTPEGAVMGKLECGASVEGSSHFGATRWGDDFYQQAFCTPKRSRYDDAPEVLYRLEVPADTKADIVLDSPCTDLDLVAVAWQLDSVPQLQHVGRVRECEMDTKSGGGKVTLTTVGKAQTYLVGVDGKNGDEGNFRISVACSTYR